MGENCKKVYDDMLEKFKTTLKEAYIVRSNITFIIAYHSISIYFLSAWLTVNTATSVNNY